MPRKFLKRLGIWIDIFPLFFFCRILVVIRGGRKRGPSGQRVILRGYAEPGVCLGMDFGDGIGLNVGWGKTTIRQRVWVGAFRRLPDHARPGTTWTRQPEARRAGLA